MLTLFSTAKAFRGQFDVIQRNALASWTHLGVETDVILFGDDPGAAQVCEQLGIRHVPDVAVNEFGTPLLSDMFQQAQELGRGETCCFINADIILLPEFVSAVEAIANWSADYFVVGRRTDIDVDVVLDFSDGWDAMLRDVAAREGELMPEVWIDFFVFPRGRLVDIPQFAIGRTGYDNWLIWYASQLGLKVVDITPTVSVIHQRHDYSHGGGKTAVWEGAEAHRQRSMLGHWTHMHAVSHARFMLEAEEGVVPAKGMSYRLARPRRVASHYLRFTRPLRRRLAGERASRKG